MIRILNITVGCVAGAMTVACANQVPTAPAGEVMLTGLEFTQAEVAVGEPMILVGRPAAAESVGPEPFVLTAQSGSEQQAWFTPLPTRRPWDALTDEELAAVIDDWDNVVMLRFKESGAESGVDEQGQSITSQETVERMKEWVREQGVTITREWMLQPGVTGTMPGDPDLISVLRAHENMDLVEPGGGPGEPETVREPIGAGDLVAVIQTTNVPGSVVTVQAGDAITAKYHQPDGSTLTATIAIRN